MYVRPAARGLGAGASLLQAAIDTAGELGFERLLLETMPGPMDVALGLYRRAGFRDTDGYAIDLPGVIALALDLSVAA
jgi:GNAT superfamily N-acetyltransferase